MECNPINWLKPIIYSYNDRTNIKCDNATNPIHQWGDEPGLLIGYIDANDVCLFMILEHSSRNHTW